MHLEGIYRRNRKNSKYRADNLHGYPSTDNRGRARGRNKRLYSYQSNEYGAKLSLFRPRERNLTDVLALVSSYANGDRPWTNRSQKQQVSRQVAPNKQVCLWGARFQNKRARPLGVVAGVERAFILNVNMLSISVWSSTNDRLPPPLELLPSGAPCKLSEFSTNSQKFGHTRRISFIVMTVDIALSQWSHWNCVRNHMELCRKR